MSEQVYGRSDPDYIAIYSEYQQRYATTIRESDRVLVDHVREVAGGDSLTLLDIGCSTGNLLRHLRHLAPELELVGGDITPEVLEANRSDPELAGVAFEELDLLELPEARFDVVVANAILGVFDDDDFARAAASLAGSLKPGGTLLAFDWFHPFEQNLAIRERSTRLDVMLYFRPYSLVRRLLGDAGFEQPDFRPFELPLDLERPADPADLTSYTVRMVDGSRLVFRGWLAQPWCHLVARTRG